MSMKTDVQAGGITFNRSRAVGPERKGLKVRSNIKAGPGSGAGGVWLNHNQSVSSGLRIKSKVKAGGLQLNHNQTVTPVTRRAR